MSATPAADMRPYLNSFYLSVQAEAEQCVQGLYPIAGRTTASQAETEQVVYLISVGGLQVQDLPMSGQLQASGHLADCAHLRAFLSCFTPALGRVYLVRRPIPHEVNFDIYRNSSHRLFYQTVYLDLDRAPDDAMGESSLSALQHERPDSALYLAVEIARHSDDFIVLDTDSAVAEAIPFDEKYFSEFIRGRAESHRPLNTVSARLDILSVQQIEQGLHLIRENCRALLDVPEWLALTEAGQFFLHEWKDLFARFGRDYKGEWSYQCALNRFRETLIRQVNPVLVGMSPAHRQQTQQVIDSIAFQLNLFPPAPQRINRKTLNKSRHRKPLANAQAGPLPRFDRPLFIVSAPRSGSSLLFETLVQFKDVWSTGEENHARLEAIRGLHPRDNGWESNRLNADHANEAIKHDVVKMFVAHLQDQQYRQFFSLPEGERPAAIRFVEKTPKNALRIPFIKKLFPDALFLFLHREAESNISSLIDGWRSQRFIAYSNVADCAYRNWSFLLISGWRDLLDSSIGEIAARQWQVSNRTIEDDLTKLSSSDWMALDYQELIDQPMQSMQAISRFADFTWDAGIEARCRTALPVSRLTLSAPQKNKWRKHSFLMNSIPGVYDHGICW